MTRTTREEEQEKNWNVFIGGLIITVLLCIATGIIIMGFVETATELDQAEKRLEEAHNKFLDSIQEYRTELDKICLEDKK